MAAELDLYLKPTWFVESDAPSIESLAREVVGPTSDEIERACRLFYAVRDGIRYDAYNIVVTRETLRATHVLESGRSWCVPKSVLLAAMCRAAGIPCRLCYANVRNHMATKKLLKHIGTDIFYYHGYNELFLGGRWVKATVSFNRTLCEKARLAPLDFDGVHDSIYHPFDLSGQRYMEYLHDYGAFADVPYDDLVAKFAEVYPSLTYDAASSASLSGDFEAEIAAEAADAQRGRLRCVDPLAVLVRHSRRNGKRGTVVISLLIGRRWVILGVPHGRRPVVGLRGFSAKAWAGNAGSFDRTRSRGAQSMKRPVFFLAMLTLVSLALGQQQPPTQTAPYQPAVPAPSIGMYGGGSAYGFGGGVGSTAAGSSMTGMANVISAKGDYNLSTSAAAINYTQAQKQEIENRQQYTNTYFEMQATNKQARAIQDGPPPTAEQLARIAHETAPKPLSPGEVNAVTGKLNWPSALQLDSFAAGRSEFEKLFGSYSQMGTLNYADQTKARQIIDGMNKQLKGIVRDIPPTDYTVCKSFLKSLMYTTCKCQLS